MFLICLEGAGEQQPVSVDSTTKKVQDVNALLQHENKETQGGGGK